MHDYASRRIGLAGLYQRHLHTLSVKGMSQRLTVVRKVEDVIEMQNVRNRQKYDYLEEIGWSTPDYLRSQGIPEDKLGDVRDEIRRLRAAQNELRSDYEAT